ncbi:NtaA/DmoA family FMN-dependent monooxygenase [Lacisediminihabitans sp.]|uniref:NtaA/DmoA family FMN-dependent monooxygenase n=1 Tax=Lacisediminihabitans sp. TaxID=2787631 RepID=UPI00374D79B7
MTAPKKLILNLFEMNCASHITHGLWRLPGNNRHRFNEIGYWTELAQLAEAGGFDAIFLADVIGAYDVFGDSAAAALEEGLQIPNNDPMLVVPAMAAVTKNLGFGVTFSTSYEPPFAFARRMSTLDHLTDGRVGWNVVTSYLPNAARNFGLDDQIPHDTRYDIAEEYLEVLYKLWEGSWEDDAVVIDRENNVYADPAKVHRIDHVGAHFTVAGPHLSQPSRQRTPVMFLATASSAGIARAARHAEVVFTSGSQVRRVAAETRAAAAENGRRHSDVAFLVQAGVITARTQAEVDEKLALYKQHASARGRLVHASVPFDALAHPLDRTIGEALAIDGKSEHPAAAALPRDKTIAEFLALIDDTWSGPFFSAGTPENVADDIERWLDEEGIDGINLRQYHSFDTLKDFVELIVPVLRRRGRLRQDYVHGQSLRDRLFGEGDRLPDRHVARSYRPVAVTE